ncbi:NAD(P)-binding protein [Calocera cornea HHB12733]|uniref:NAD(P)-binding protein n=1 Tax=Calocera cornea HHB12733 TaxID=1353952 RepID=A0A165I0Q8_9BASI|nr:NAD(P)-binding protein [Calocera cornea HHB12733]
MSSCEVEGQNLNYHCNIMPPYKRFAVAGASGTVGTHFLRAFEHSPHGYDVTILTRKRGGNQQFAAEWRKKGAKVREVDYEDEASLVSALHKIEVVISTLGGPAFALQVPLVKAAKKAGVQLYVNSHWGSPLTGDDLPDLATMDALRNAPLRMAEEVGLPWVEFRNGTFPEYCLPIPLFGMSELGHRRATIYGDGNIQNSWTTQVDTVAFVLHVLRHLPAEELKNRIFNIQGDLKSFNEIVQLYETKYPGSPFDVIYRPLFELEGEVEHREGVERLLSSIMLAVVTGKAKHNQETLDNKAFPEWNPRAVVDVL